MARTRFIDFRAPDSTKLLNEKLRGIVQHGVYAGFNVSAGSTGFYLTFTHDADPDRTAAVLGTLVTPDGVVIQEDANQTDVVLGSVSLGTPNIHYVVGTYTYNQALPNNDIVYSVRQGTAGSTPVPPLLSDDDVLIAIIDVPASASSYSYTGTVIKNAKKISLSSVSQRDIVPYLDGILRPGIYDGITMYKGSGDLKVSVTAGTWVTKENIEITESAALGDLVTLIDPGIGMFKFSWLVGLHKHETIQTEPDVDYILVEGTSVAVGSAATIPADGTILTAATAYNAKYDSSTYVNKIGLIRVENRSSTYYIDYIKCESCLDQESITVYGANSKSLNRSGKYYGYVGLKQAIDDIYAVSNTIYNKPECPYTVLLDGEFRTDDGILQLPSNILLKGNGSSAKILSECSTTPVSISGYVATWNTVNDTVIVSSGSSTPPSASYVAKIFAIQPTYQTGYELAITRFSYGDKVSLYSTSTLTTYTGIFVQRTASWTFEAFAPTNYNTDGNKTDLGIIIAKRNCGLENVELSAINSGNCELKLSIAENCYLNNVVTDKIRLYGVQNSSFGNITVKKKLETWSPVAFAGAYFGGYNLINRFTLLDSDNTSTISLPAEPDHIILFEYYNPTNATTIVTYGSGLKCDSIVVTGSTGSIVSIGDSNQFHKSIENKSSSGIIRINSGSNSFIEYAKANTVTITASASANNIIAYANASSVTNASSDPTNSILFSTLSSAHAAGQYIANLSEDRNLKLMSAASLTWNSVTGILSWDAPLIFDIPWQTGYTEISAGSNTLSVDGDRLYADINRDATGTSTTTTFIRNKASATSDAYYKHRVFVAVRNQSVIYLFDGTRIEPGQTVKVGSTPPPDNSVTYPKLADSAKTFHNKFFRNYVYAEDNIGYEDLVSFYNSTAVAFIYFSTTGKCEYASAVDLSNVRVGDSFIFRNVDYDPTSVGQRAYTRERILEVNNAADYVRIAKGLDPTVGSAHRWNGSIVRGGMICSNKALSTFTYTKSGTNAGRITFSSGYEFSTQMVYPGCLFRDSGGTYYPIMALDTSGNGAFVEIEPGLTTIDTTSPTNEYQGAIYANNNALELNLADLKVNAGMEFIPIDSIGEQDIKKYSKCLLVKKYGATAFTEQAKLFYSNPSDNRIRLMVGEPVAYRMLSDGLSCYYPYDTNAEYLIFTGICSGFTLAYTNVSSSTTHIYSVYVDGKLYTETCAQYESSIDDANFCTVPHNPCHIQSFGSPISTSATNTRRFSALWRLPQGIHTIIVGVSTAGLRGIVVFNDTSDISYTSQPKVLRSPGHAIISGGEVDFTTTTLDEVPRDPISGWRKGSNHTKYIDKNGLMKWASTYINNFTDIGNTSASSPDITLVVIPSLWTIGDLILLISPGSASPAYTKYIRRITNISGTTITVDSAIPFTQTSTVLYYYGKSFNGDTRTSSPSYILGSHSRLNEEITATIPITEFACGGPIDQTNRVGFAWDSVNAVSSGNLGVRLGDLSTFASAYAGITNGVKYVSVTSADFIRIGFIGSGISLNTSVASAQTLDATLDSCSLGYLYLTPGTPYWSNEDSGGTYVAGELPYGYHVLILSNALSLVNLYGITVWGPKHPSIASGDQPALELWNTNCLSTTDSNLGIVVADGTPNVQMGTIQHEFSSVSFGRTSGSVSGNVEDLFFSTSTFYGDTTTGRIYTLYGLLYTDKIAIDQVFYGSEITLISDRVADNGTPLIFYILDNDGQWRAPGSTIGFISSGPTTATTHTTSGKRYRFTFDKLGVYTIRILCTANSQEFGMDAYEIGCPYHTYKTKIPYSLDHYVPFQFSGTDIRNLTPFANAQIPLLMQCSNQYLETAYKNDDYWYKASPFWFYSFGGAVELKLTASLYTSSMSIPGSISVSTIIDGKDIDKDQAVTVDAEYGYFDDVRKQICINVSVILEQGLHYAALKSTIYTSDIRWSANAHRPISASLVNRCLGISASGQTLPGELSY